MFSDYNARIEKLETDLKILRTSKIINDVSAASAFEAINLPTIKDRIEKLEDKDKYHDRVCGNLRNLIDKLEQRISLQEKYYRHQEIESPQKCNPELDGAVDADELHQAIQNLSDAFIVFKKGRE